MVWTSPMTAVVGSALTSAIFNREIRDNLNQQAVAKATTVGSYFTTYSANLLVERFAATDTLLTSESTSSTSFTDLATVGRPSVTCTTGSKALVLWNARQSNSLTNAFVGCAVEVAGDSYVPASVNWALSCDGKATVSQSERGFGMHLFDTLNPGTNTFTLLYMVASGTGTWLDRELAVLPL